MQREWQSRPLEELMKSPWMQGDTALGDVARWFAATVEENLTSPLWTERYEPIVAQ